MKTGIARLQKILEERIDLSPKSSRAFADPPLALVFEIILKEETSEALCGYTFEAFANQEQTFSVKSLSTSSRPLNLVVIVHDDDKTCFDDEESSLLSLNNDHIHISFATLQDNEIVFSVFQIPSESSQSSTAALPSSLPNPPRPLQRSNSSPTSSPKRPLSSPVLRAKTRLFIDAISTEFVPAFYKFQVLGDSSPQSIGSMFEAEFSNANGAIAPFLVRWDVGLSEDIGAYGEGEGEKVWDLLSKDAKYERFRRYLKILEERESVKKTSDTDYIRDFYGRRFAEARAKRKAQAASA
ncbi:hypothetical protein D9758_013284 [Tetrapyrgos nigripes]|uniref:Uncharacterized protein n=1 Tax=Tetrapyrgos nigripes TaxID=182062 RepID=A0A8H5FPX1_9AGAR|nr:hypothetical protein D9758_013284 [Tetrapyrgos nigripes]